LAVSAVHVQNGSASAEHPAGADLLRLDGVSKRYPGVTALDNVDFDLKAGEVHVLFGENGAGKSTLISIISGAQRPSSGALNVAGQPVSFAGVHDARASGISAVFQEFSLVPQLTVGENIFLGEEMTRGPFLDRSALRRQARAILDRLGFQLDPDHRVLHLSRAEQQMVEIAKAFRSTPSVLIFDEPTASLTERETERLFALIAQAKRDGVGIIYITHRMGEIRRIGDRITVLRDGRKVATLGVAEASDEKLIELMTGRVITQVFPKVNHRPAETRLEVRGLTTIRLSVRDVSLSVRGGEIVGLAGLVGSGKSETGRACFGLERIRSGSVVFDGEDVTGRPVSEMLKRGMFYLPSDRRNEGLLLVRGARENISLAALGEPAFSRGGVLRRSAERMRTAELARHVQLRPLEMERPLEQFSGGNQQKIMIAKALSRDIRLFIFDEPTVGVDVGTRVSIYGFIRDLCEAGAGVLLISSDLPEILHLSHRAYVMYRGELRAELQEHEITEENVLSHFFEREAA
jgi:ribose transport system ATP-binding protein